MQPASSEFGSIWRAGDVNRLMMDCTNNQGTNVPRSPKHYLPAIRIPVLTIRILTNPDTVSFISELNCEDFRLNLQ